MESLVVVTHPEPIQIEARPMDEVDAPEGSIALGYYHEGNVLARGVVAEEALDAITGLLRHPVSVALAALEDEEGNIDARVCLVLPVDSDEFLRDPNEEEDSDEPWKASLPPVPDLHDTWSADGSGPESLDDDEDEDDEDDDDDDDEEDDEDEDDDDQPKLALLPIGNAVRGARDRHHTDVVGDAREMLENLLRGRGRDAVSKAIDDLLDSI